MNILLLGGDLRQFYASKYLADEGYGVNFISAPYDLDALRVEIDKADVLILPLPISRDGKHLNVNGENYKLKLDDMIDLIPERLLVAGGLADDNIKRKFEKIDIRIIDYNTIEAFKVSNALLSAEGAIYYACERLKKSIYDSDILVMGYGRIGKFLTDMLRSQGARVTVLMRNIEDIKRCALKGISTINLTMKEEEILCRIEDHGFDLAFNTIPHHIFEGRVICEALKRSLIIDLASYPFGIDGKMAERCGLDYHLELGIPGRYAPVSAGKIIARTIVNDILNGRT